MEPEKSKTLSLGKSWGGGHIVGREQGGTEDRGGARVCPRGNPDDRNWNVS